MSDLNETEIQAKIAEHQAQIELLQKQQSELEQKGKTDAIADINTKIEKFGITAKDLKWPKKLATGKSKSKGKPWPPKYKDPDSDATWNGRGKAPRWIAGKDRTPFLINQEAAEFTPASAPPAKAKKAS